MLPFSIDGFQCLHISRLHTRNSDITNKLWRQKDAER